MLNLRRLFPSLALIAALIALAPTAAWAQSVNLDLGAGSSSAGRLVQLSMLVTILALAPSILVMVTSFTRIVVVLSFLRSAIGVQQTPPNAVMISLALFLTLFIMQPTMEKAWNDSVMPLMNNEIEEDVALVKGVEPFQQFMAAHTRAKDLELFMRMATAASAEAKKMTAGSENQPSAPAAEPTPTQAKNEVPLRALIPAFMISELRRAFEIGFLLFLPFLIIDMIIASILMSMGMMMLPPASISMPFKIIFFVLVDGWYLIAGSLVQSYGGG